MKDHLAGYQITQVTHKFVCENKQILQQVVDQVSWQFCKAKAEKDAEDAGDAVARQT